MSAVQPARNVMEALRNLALECVSWPPESTDPLADLSRLGECARRTWGPLSVEAVTAGALKMVELGRSVDATAPGPGRDQGTGDGRALPRGG